MDKNQTQLEGGTYEIIQNRLQKQTDQLRAQLELLNQERKKVFGAVEMQLVANDRINTDNYCVASDIVALKNHCIFGYNVHVGLRSGIKVEDVFSCYDFVDNSFVSQDLSLIDDDKFKVDFQNLYRYYKMATFYKFVKEGAYLYMVFQISKKVGDFKAFKWLIKDEELVYIDARSDHEVRDPEQYEFRWKLAGRDAQRSGEHPHVSINDKVFVETVGGDLTIKVEDNTDDGRGIYEESVEYPDQTLDDADYYYAEIGSLIVLKIRPYQEDYRFFVFNEKMQEVKRVDALEDSGVLLPDGHGLIFANGYYLQTGEHKVFDTNVRNKQFLRRIISPNGEDYLFVFFDKPQGIYVLLFYNIIQQKVATPISCHGFTLFTNGELCYFKAEDDPTKHHVVQIWQTPFIQGTILPSEHKESLLYKIGNKEVVKAMAESYEIITLAGKEDAYANLYDELVRKSTDVIDSYYWIDKPETFELNIPLGEIRNIATLAIDEYEKKVRIQRNTKTEITRVQAQAEELFKKAKRQTFDTLDQFVETLAAMRIAKGEIISLKELKYTDLALVETLEKEATESNEFLAQGCVEFLLQEDALVPYQAKIDAKAGELEKVETGKQAEEQLAAINKIGEELELMIEIVSNLKIDDPTQTTRIIDNITAMYSGLNQAKAAVQRKQKDLMGTEATAEFGAQLKLIDQSIINYLDVSDSPEKCDEYMTKLMVQLEELEGKFVEFDSFIADITTKREEVVAAFEARKNTLVEARNNRTSSLVRAAERILGGINNRIKNFKEVTEINAFFASDLMIDKVRDIIKQLHTLEDSNKANDIQTKLKTLKEEGVRQLRDKKDLFTDGQNIIQFGRHKFTVNVQPLDLTIVQKDSDMLFHLTGTDFYQTIEEPDFLATKSVWNQQLISETEEVYRAEYLAYQLFEQSKLQTLLEKKDLAKEVQQFAAPRYQEGYTKGIHDADATKLLKKIVAISKDIDLLYFTPKVRTAAQLLWNYFLEADQKEQLDKQLKSAGIILEVFPDSKEFDYLLEDILEVLDANTQLQQVFSDCSSEKIAHYLFLEQARAEEFLISKDAVDLKDAFLELLKSKKSTKQFKKSVEALEDTVARFQLIRQWVQASVHQLKKVNPVFIDEAALLLLTDNVKNKLVIQTSTSAMVKGLHGSHDTIENGNYQFDYYHFFEKMEAFSNTVVPRYEAFIQMKKQFTEDFKAELRLSEFKPKVLSSFVRNQLIDKLYLPIFGDNLAKQIGTAGENTRTDRMGMLLLISPPGYGKTTLMEYVANRLGLIFMKINGPAIGHQVTSLDPTTAPNLAAEQELHKLNLALEMGNNIMLYLDDIQHCNPEFLQKFISLCDGQRKIEGVYKGKSKTYDLRGKRVCVVMAGNPYTESGDKFQIPDMLANRADIYNLGDIIGDTETIFKLSYIENSLTSNPILAQLANKGMKDVYAFIKYAETGSREGLSFEANYDPAEVNEYIQVLEKMLIIRDVVLKVNQAYIESAAMEDAYRTEPAFKLQGSYRNMNKLAEKVVPIMNAKELNTLILSHYEGESQTLTSSAEANFLKLKELLGMQTDEELERWTEIKKRFGKNQRMMGVDGKDPMAKVISQMSAFVEGLDGIREELKNR